ncbi:MAG: class I SAM-dependent DNA methyltransferase [Gammaproteobacteria bacterium]|nr:class I SAM-dependent DNA methyltransferase [Rhodocyclaceae bacterium]MBU3908411.1 class I SAM-dependent DNA methyltransferase [Gammaproteobacteria bacterium]MBU4005960.1 class I SAM-dependent DNA methyltransferase [Gammaproteobacteria bacterium]MBU4021042.1 class I SAM-dependent DNA methyltransferase [Gammaproteobacteria bacterium]MBU4096059.1 class I SAM-dependent DNA methyltransferase [Gammaproteobacteria bacterium]
MTIPADSVESFIARWQGVSASELATAQSFVIDLCALLDIAPPHATADQDYMFERPISFSHGDGGTSPGRIDCYKLDCFVLEAKKLKVGAGKTASKVFDDALLRARSQAEGYARALPAAEGRPPFLIVVDVGNVIELYAEFSRSGATYTPFPDPRSHRIRLADLRDAAIRARLATIWLDPLALDPATASAKVTRAIATHLAEVAKSLEAAKHSPETVAGFLTRCLFSMFAEDVGLIPKGSFTTLLHSLKDDTTQFVPLVGALWQEMDRGGFSVVLRQTLPRFNGKLFKQPEVLPLTKQQIALLIEAAKADWTQVEPAIFGTLLERALDPHERHALGAHYTPRAYVDRLVQPTVIEPLRQNWAYVQGAAVLLANEGKHKEAVAELRNFHHKLCHLRVLDPACGSGNFLYVALEHLKRLEGEVLNQLHDIGETQSLLEAAGLTVDPHQFLGLEINPRAAAIAELVLWIGYLQWHFRTQGSGLPPSPILKDFHNIECRDAVLAHDGMEYVLDEKGIPVSRWDGRTFKTHPVTGEPVPNEAARVPLERYKNPRRADWPAADVVVGNPPFIGAASMRQALGDGYVDALRGAWQAVPESADFVMFWWHHAAQLVANGQLSRFGFITTNSLRQTFNRRVVQAALDSGLHLDFAIPDHPWVDSADGAAVRIAMTVAAPGKDAGRRLDVIAERESKGEGLEVDLVERSGSIHADLAIGANVAAAQALRANENLSNRGFCLFGAGFIVPPEETANLEADAPIKPYRNGRDLTDRPRGVSVIDLYGHDADTVRRRWPATYQWVLERVKPERDHNKREVRKRNWWLFGEPNPKLRQQLAGMPRYIATVETAKHRVFQFLDAIIAPDNKLVCIVLDDGYALGVLSSRVHVAWALASGTLLENRPVYNKGFCFETFPFPAASPEQQARIGDLAEQIDAHRKRVLAAHAELTLTGLYNVLVKVGAGETALNAKEKTIHEKGLVAVLKSLHDELDAAVLAAYGWHDNPSDETLLERLVLLNTARTAEEAQGHIRWLRPEFQAPAATQTSMAGMGVSRPTICDSREEVGTPPSPPAPRQQQPWPTSLPEQMAALAAALSPQPQSAADLATQFTGKGKWKSRLPELLATLATLGRARCLDDNRWVS